MSEVEDQLDLQWKTIERQMRQSAANNNYGGCDKSVKQTRLADYLAKEYHVIATACKRSHRNSGAQCHNEGKG